MLFAFFFVVVVDNEGQLIEIILNTENGRITEARKSHLLLLYSRTLVA